MRVGYEFGEIEPSLLDHPKVSDVLESVFCLTGCLRLGACLAFFEGCCVKACPFPLFLVFTMFRVREVLGNLWGEGYG